MKVDLRRDHGRVHRFLEGQLLPWLYIAFMDHIAMDIPNAEPDAQWKERVWPAIADCTKEIYLIYCDRQGWIIEADDTQLIGAASCMLALNTMLSFDFVPFECPIPLYGSNVDHTLPPLPVNSPPKNKRPHADSMSVVLAHLSDGAFTAQRLHRMFFEVFAATGFKGCMGTERRYATHSTQGGRERRYASHTTQGGRKSSKRVRKIDRKMTRSKKHHESR